MTETKQQFTSTWDGKTYYHPCDYETYMKLRRLNYLWNKARERLAAWERWNRKLPQNRILRRKIRSEGRVIGRKIVLDTNNQPIPISEPKLPPIITIIGNKKLVGDSWINLLYRIAKIPTTEPAEHFRPEQLEMINDRLARLEEWYKN